MEVNHNALQAELQEIDAQAGAFTGADGAQTVDAVAQVVGQPASSQNRPEDIIGALKLAVHVLSPMFPSLLQVYTDETCRQVAEAVVPVMDKHGWSMSALFGLYQEEIQCALVVIPVMMSTYKAVAHDIAARQAAASEAERKPEEGGEGVQQ